MNQLISVFRKEHFNAAHRLYRPDWDDERNRAVFGKCSNPYFHGHNYELIVKITGPIDPETGFVIDLKILSDLIKEHIVDVFDHKNLNEDCAAFKNVNPTAENIAIEIYNILLPKLPKDLILQVRLYETERNFVEYPVV